MRKLSKKIRLIKQKQLEEEQKVFHYRLTYGIAMILVCILLSITLFIGWQRGMAKPGESKFQREKSWNVPISKKDNDLMSILNKENNELLKIVTEGTKNPIK